MAQFNKGDSNQHLLMFKLWPLFNNSHPVLWQQFNKKSLVCNVRLQFLQYDTKYEELGLYIYSVLVVNNQGLCSCYYCLVFENLCVSIPVL